MFRAQRNRSTTNASSNGARARRTATTVGNCDFGFERRRVWVTATGGGTSSVMPRKEARSSLQFEPRSIFSS